MHSILPSIERFVASCWFVMVRGYALLSDQTFSSHIVCTVATALLFTLRHVERTSQQKRKTDYHRFPRSNFKFNLSLSLSIFAQHLYLALFGQILGSDFTGCEICKSRLAYRTNGFLFGKARKATRHSPVVDQLKRIRSPYTYLSTYLLLEPQRFSALLRCLHPSIDSGRLSHPGFGCNAKFSPFLALRRYRVNVRSIRPSIIAFLFLQSKYRRGFVIREIFASVKPPRIKGILLNFRSC